MRTSGIVITWLRDHLVPDIAPRQHLGERMADEFGHPLLTLRWGRHSVRSVWAWVTSGIGPDR